MTTIEVADKGLLSDLWLPSPVSEDDIIDANRKLRRKEPLFGSYTSVIAVNRMGRPNNGKLYSVKVIEGMLKHLVEEKGFTASEAMGLVKGNLETLLDDSEERLHADIENCDFCYPNNIEKTCEPKNVMTDLGIPKDGANIGGMNGHPYAFTNKMPSKEGHSLLVFTTHKTNFSSLTYEDMENFMESRYRIHRTRKNQGNDGVASGINHDVLGKKGGSTQFHFHGQDMTVDDDMLTRSDHEASKADYMMLTHGVNIFDLYIQTLRRLDLVSYEDEHVVIAAPYAQQFAHEMIVFPKSGAATILEMERDERISVARSMLGIFHSYEKDLYVKGLNVVMHQARFNHGDTAMRMHFHFMPRFETPAFFELGENIFAITSFSHETAKHLRNHYRRAA
jgi:diadenosine tetraphosphate (Ap4A) HIT family hydrolase